MNKNVIIFCGDNIPTNIKWLNEEFDIIECDNIIKGNLIKNNEELSNNRLYNTCVYLERELSHLINVNHDLPTEIKSVYPRQIVGSNLIKFQNIKFISPHFWYTKSIEFNIVSKFYNTKIWERPEFELFLENFEVDENDYMVNEIKFHHFLKLYNFDVRSV